MRGEQRRITAPSEVMQAPSRLAVFFLHHVSSMTFHNANEVFCKHRIPESLAVISGPSLRIRAANARWPASVFQQEEG